jgi:hypothetical protein
VELTEDESAMLGGALGPARRRAIEHQLKLGRYFRARFRAGRASGYHGRGLSHPLIFDWGSDAV